MADTRLSFCISVTFHFHYVEMKTGRSSIPGPDSGSKSSLDTHCSCPQPLKSMGLHIPVHESQLESDDVRSELLSAIHACLRVLKKKQETKSLIIDISKAIYSFVIRLCLEYIG